MPKSKPEGTPVETCAESVQIAKSGAHQFPIWVPKDAAAYPDRVAYISGPMRGKPGSNFPAFDECRESLLADGWHVVSPADIDRMHGFFGFEPVSDQERRGFLCRDIAIICDPIITDIVLLSEWAGSKGAQIERSVGEALDLTFHDWSPRMGLWNTRRGNNAAL